MRDGESWFETFAKRGEARVQDSLAARTILEVSHRVSSRTRRGFVFVMVLIIVLPPPIPYVF